LFFYDYLKDKNKNKMSLICEFCNCELSSRYSLERHKKTSKKCLLIQNKDNSNSIVFCEYCNKSTSKYNLKSHLLICKDKIIHEHEKEKKQIRETLEENNNKLLKQISKLKKKISKLKNKENNIYKKLFEENNKVVAEIAKQPKTSNTNTSHNRINVNNTNNTFTYFDEPDKVAEIIKNNLTIEHIIDGQKGVAEFTLQYFLKNIDGTLNYMCTDPSRKRFKYLSPNGTLEKDIKARKLTCMLLNGNIKQETIKKATEFWTNEDGSEDTDKYILHNQSAQEIVNMSNDNKIFRNSLSEMTI
jgi:hypothetical protein